MDGGAVLGQPGQHLGLGEQGLAAGRRPVGIRHIEEINGSEANGIQLGSKCGLYQGLAQQTSWFAHKREGFGPPLFDPGLDTVGPCGIEE